MLRETSGNKLARDTLAAIEQERQSADSQLATWPVQARTESAWVQPSALEITTDFTTTEEGLGKIYLLNESALAQDGDLQCQVTGAEISTIRIGAEGVVIQLQKTSPLGKQTGSAKLHLLPLQELRLTILCGPDVAQAEAQLRWSTAAGTKSSRVTFLKEADSASSSILGQGQLQQPSSIPLPVEHQIYYRGAGNSVEDTLIRSQGAARLEIYDSITGKLLAVDADGDGQFQGAEDFLSPEADANSNGFPDASLSAAHQVAEWEIYALPAQANKPVSIQLFLARNGQWEPQGQDEVKR
jgi:hypothetical protein